MPNAKTLLAPLDERRDNNFDFLRFALATLVVISHSWMLSSHNRALFLATEPLQRLTRGQIDFGDFAVDGFFLISGFLITNSWLHSRGAVEFLKKRVLRIYPGFLAAVLVGLVVVGPLGTSDLHAYIQSISPLKSLYYMAQLVGPPVKHVFSSGGAPDQLNGSLWTIRYEFWCYLLVLLLGVCAAFGRRYALLALTAAVYATFIIQSALHVSILHGRELKLLGAPDVYPRFLTYFLMGMAFYLFRDVVPRSKVCLWLTLLVVLGTAIAGIGLAAVLPLCGGYLLIWFAFAPAVKLHNFGTRADLSYGTYLYAFPIQQLCLYIISSHMPPLMLVAISYPITLLVAVISWHLVESPCLKLKKWRESRISPPLVGGAGGGGNA